MNAEYAVENAAERQRLFALTSAWTESDLMREMPNGWTVATTLVHLAFWDRYCLVLVEGCERTGAVSPPPDMDAINWALQALCLSVPPSAAVDLARAAAESIDGKLESITAELETAIESSGRARLLHRAIHRRLHLDQIEKALGR